jgi:hypothetical protein
MQAPPSPQKRILVILAPTFADVASVRRLWQWMRPLGVALEAASECHGEIRGEHGEPLLPNLLLVEAAGRAWDALLVGGGRGARRVARDPFARQLLSSTERPVAALGEGRLVLERASIAQGFVTDDADELARWLVDKLALQAPKERSNAWNPLARFVATTTTRRFRWS